MTFASFPPARKDAYGSLRCQALAAFSPKDAILNADNYALYATAIAIGAQVGMPEPQDLEKVKVTAVIKQATFKEPPSSRRTELCYIDITNEPVTMADDASPDISI